MAINCRGPKNPKDETKDSNQNLDDYNKATACSRTRKQKTRLSDMVSRPMDKKYIFYFSSSPKPITKRPAYGLKLPTISDDD